MLAHRNPFLAILVLLASVTLTTAWKNKYLQDWDNGWTQNIFGEPLDPKTACNGEPCIKTPLIKPAPVSSIRRNARVCKPSASDDQAFMCNHTPKDATLVSNQEFKRLFPTTGGPMISHTPKTNRTLQKRNRWSLDTGSGSFEMHTWKNTEITYSIAAASGLSNRIASTADAIDAALGSWAESCGLDIESGYNDPFIQKWRYVPSAATANIWFYIAPDTVCDKPAALACAFFPHEYHVKRVTVMINNSLLKGKDRNGVILTMAHEIGHVLGLAHEEKNDNRNIWVASDFDYDSIMKPSHIRLTGITASDCLAMDYYDKGFPQAQSCKVHPTQGKKCTKAAPKTVLPKSHKLGSSQHYWEPKNGGHDELLMDTADGTCLGGDISKYMTISPLDNSKMKSGWLTLGHSISQCTAIQVPSDPDFFYAMQSDGNFVGYNSKTRKAVSSTGSAGLGTKGGYNILFQEDGNLVIYDAKGKPTWSSRTNYRAENTFRLIPDNWVFKDGTFYIQDSKSTPMWVSGGNYYIYNKVSIELKGTGYCLDAGGRAEGTGAILYKCNGGVNQKWDVMTNGQIQNTHSGLCLDNPEHGTHAGNPINIYKCHGGPNQQWKLLNDGTIKNKEANMCIDNAYSGISNGNKIHMWGCNAQGAQQWVIKP